MSYIHIYYHGESRVYFPTSALTAVIEVRDSAGVTQGTRFVLNDGKDWYSNVPYGMVCAALMAGKSLVQPKAGEPAVEIL